MLHPFKNKQKKHEEEQYMDFVTRVALPALQNGNIGYVNSLQRIFTIKEAKHYHIEVANVFAELFAHTSVKELIHFDEKCRYYNMYEAYTINWWDIDWCSLKLSREMLSYLSDEQYTAILRFGTFHSNGYFRQMCMEELAQYPDNLPFFVLRLNDWVKEIRLSAYQLVIDRIHVCSIQELFSAMPMLYKVKNCQRRDRSHLGLLEMQIQEQIETKFSDCSLSSIPAYDINVKNSIYRFVNQNKVLTLSQMEQLCFLEKNGYGKRLLILGIFKHFTCTEAMIFHYLSDKSAIVRCHALEYYYAKRKDTWPELEQMLMDKSKKIRDNVCYILKRHSQFDILGYYKEQLQKQEHAVAILGIGENGSKEDIDIIFPYLDSSNEHFAKAALQAYGMLAMEQGEMVYWNYLLCPSTLLSRQAYHLIKKYDIHYGAKTIYETYLEHQNLPVAEKLVLLLTKEPSWSRLPYLLLLSDAEGLSENTKNVIQKAVNTRNVYAKVSPEQEAYIRSILEQKRNYILDNLYEQILFDLKYVTS